MSPPPLHALSEAEKNELLLAQHDMIERMAARISELEALVGKPRKTSKNSYASASWRGAAGVQAAREVAGLV